MVSQKAQAWGIDLMAAMTIFIVAITVFFVYSLNQSGEARSIIEDLNYDGKIFSNDLTSEGYPDDWVEANVVKIGLTNGGKINQIKLEKFYNFSQEDYARTKLVFNLKYDYFFFFEENMTVGGLSVEGIGRPGVTRDFIENEVSNFIKVTRLMVYEDKPITANVYIWEE
ncbi:hypothetical protein HOE04_03460 [archaeon]|nr:hypothetical protein [archaeon]